MTNITMPGHAQPPQYPQTKVEITAQGVAFTISLGPAFFITHTVSHAAMDNIEARRQNELRRLRGARGLTRRAMEARL